MPALPAPISHVAGQGPSTRHNATDPSGATDTPPAPLGARGDQTRVKLSVERRPESQMVLDIAADEDEFARAMERAYRKVAREVTLPGFRKGKAPRAMIERLYGRGIFLEEAHKEIMEDLYRRALEQEAITPVGDPQVELVEPEPIAFRVTVPVYPVVDPGPYADARVEPQDASVDEAAVDEVLERLQKTQSPWVDPAEPRTPREGDQVTIDLEVKEGDEPFQEPAQDAVFVLGESNLFDALRERIEQMHVGETAQLELAFADDDETVNESIRGKALSYTITLKALKERQLLPLDDEFAKTVADADSLEELRRQIRDDLHQGKTAETRTEVVNKIINAMAETATIDLPAVMIDEAVEDDLQSFRGRLAQQRLTFEEYLRLNDQTEQGLRDEMRPAAARRLRNSLLLREIAQREGVAISDEDLDAELEALASPGANPDRLQELYQSDYFRGVLRSDLFERRITERLIELATDGRGAVINGWVEPEPKEDETAASEAPAADSEPVGAVVGDLTAAESEAETAEPMGEGSENGAEGDRPAADTTDAAAAVALTTGIMAGQPGDVAATATTVDPDATVAVEELASEPDAAQAAAVGHEAENTTVAAEAPTDAVTPEEREQGEVGAGGVFADPDY